MVAKFIALAVEDASKNPQINSWPELREYLINETISPEIVDRDQASIWSLYLGKSPKMSNSGPFPTQITHIRSPPSPPMDQARAVPSLSSPPCRIDNSETRAGTAKIIRGNAYIEILSNRNDNSSTSGCIFVGDRVESYISNDLVERLRLPWYQNNRTILVTWRIVNTHKTMQTTCIVVPSEDLPQSDIQFGTGYKDPPRPRDENMNTIEDNQFYRNQEMSPSINQGNSVAAAGGSGFNFDILAQINVATATMLSAQLNKYSRDK